MPGFFFVYYVYVLYSDRIRKKYTGFTSNLDPRIAQHNQGFKGSFTNEKGPWRLIHFEEYATEAEAIIYFPTG